MNNNSFLTHHFFKITGLGAAQQNLYITHATNMRGRCPRKPKTCRYANDKT